MPTIYKYNVFGEMERLSYINTLSHMLGLRYDFKGLVSMFILPCEGCSTDNTRQTQYNEEKVISNRATFITYCYLISVLHQQKEMNI